MKRVRIILLSLAFCVPLRVAADDASEWMNFDVREGHLIVPALVDATSATARLTAGSSRDGVAPDFLRTHGMNAGPGPIRRLSVDLTGFRKTLRDVAVMPELENDLLLGTPFLETVIVQLDYSQHRLRYLYRRALDLRGYANLPMRQSLKRGDALVAAEMQAGDRVWLSFLSGGFDELYLDRNVARARGLLDRFATGRTSRTTQDGELALERFLLPSLRLGPYELENVAVIVPTAEQQRTIDRSASRPAGVSRTGSGSLGYDVLKHFIVTVDYKRALAHIETP